MHLEIKTSKGYDGAKFRLSDEKGGSTIISLQQAPDFTKELIALDDMDVLEDFESNNLVALKELRPMEHAEIVAALEIAKQNIGVEAMSEW